MSFKATPVLCLAAMLTVSPPALAQSANDETQTPSEVLGGLIVLGIVGAMMAGGDSDDSGACDLPSYTANWSQAAKDYECWQRNQTAQYDAQLQQQREDNETLMLEMLMSD